MYHSSDMILAIFMVTIFALTVALLCWRDRPKVAPPCWRSNPSPQAQAENDCETCPWAASCIHQYRLFDGSPRP